MCVICSPFLVLHMKVSVHEVAVQCNLSCIEVKHSAVSQVQMVSSIFKQNIQHYRKRK